MNISYVKHGLCQFQNEVFESMTNQLMKLWKRGHTASYNINCSHGEAWINISSYLGYQECDNHSQSENTKNQKSKSAKRSKGSPSKLRRSKRRLESFLERKRLESSQPQQPKSPDATSASGIATTNINGSSDETSEKKPTKNNHLENPDNIQTQHVTTVDNTISEEPPAPSYEFYSRNTQNLE